MNLYTAAGLPVAIRRQIADTQVYAKHIISDGEGWRFPTLRQMPRVDASTPHQSSAADLPSRVYQHPMLASTQQHPADDTPIQGVERYPVQAHQVVRTGVITDTATRAKPRTGFPMLCLLAPP
jgi:hypothetical protein